jgi:hypothetical protein
LSKKGQNTRHGHAPWGAPNSPTYRSWRAMVERCTNPKNSAYKNYGGRGIGIDPSWRDFCSFLADMGERPERGTIERLDSNKNYGPTNCKWASRAEQSRNTRRTRLFTLDGKTQCLKDWTLEYGLKYGTVLCRMSKFGWSFERAIKTPCLGRGATLGSYPPEVDP